MSENEKEPEKRFIELYRLKLQRELDAMGYPGGEEAETAVRGSIINAGAEVRQPLKDGGSNKQSVVPGK